MFRPKPFQQLVTVMTMSGSQGQKFDQITGSTQAKALRAEGNFSLDYLKAAQQADAQAFARADLRLPVWRYSTYHWIAQKLYIPALEATGK
jgi:hypothetical protein